MRAHSLHPGLNIRPQTRMHDSRLFSVRNYLKGRQCPFKETLPRVAMNPGSALGTAPQLGDRNGRQLDLLIRMRAQPGIKVERLPLSLDGHIGIN